jgi:hypothetical protein
MRPLHALRPATRPAVSKFVKPALAVVAALAIVGAVPALLPGLVPAPAVRAEKYPEPSPYQIAWQFKFQHGTPKRIEFRPTGAPARVAYWYMTYTVSNPGDKPEKFVPNFDLLSEDGQVTHADQALPPEVFKEIKHEEGNRLLVNSRQIEGLLNPGEDEGKDGVAIWPEPMQKMGTFKIFVGGLSGEFAEIKDPDGKPLVKKDPKTGEETRVVVRKTLQLTYHARGDKVLPGPDDDHEDLVEQWVMR